MEERNQQIETLIRLVELNLDDSWLDTFKSLRNGGFLPGGGAGSLNDWGPVYSDPKQSAWYSNLYTLLRYLFDDNLDAGSLGDCKSIKNRNNIRVIRCLECGKSYQHPSVFETHIALDFYRTQLPDFTKNQRLIEILGANESFEDSNVNEYRDWLIGRYQAHDIEIYDFVSAAYKCPNCRQYRCETEHDLYRISEDNPRSFGLVKRNAGWDDFDSQ